MLQTYQKIYSYDFKDEQIFLKECVYKEKNNVGSKQVREEANKLFLSKNHSELIHKEVLIKYCKSIALAPNNSEELALALGNRSCFLFHIGKYQECVSDIDYALQFNVTSQTFKPKLLCRKISCLMILNKKLEANKVYEEAKNILNELGEKDKNKVLFDLNNAIVQKPKIWDQEKVTRKDLNKDLPFISKDISLKYDKNFGIHIQANKNIKTGEIVLIDKAYCAHPHFSELYIVCSHCLKQTFNCIPCGNCVFAVYCSSDCKTDALKEYHDIECLVYPKIFVRFIHLHQLFTLRLFIKILKEIGIKALINEADLPDYRAEENSSKCETSFSQKNILSDCNKYQFCKYLLEQKVFRKCDNIDLKTVEEEFCSFALSKIKETIFFQHEKIFLENMEKLRKVFTKLHFKSFINNFDFQVLDPRKFFVTEVGTSNNTLTQLGGVMNTVSCFLNHNCDSNLATYCLEGPRMVSYTIQPVKKNEQLYFSYGPSLLDSPESRKNQLKVQYNFKCNCIACKENWPALLDIVNKKNYHVDKKQMNKTMGDLITNDLSYILYHPLKWIDKENAIEGVSKYIDILYTNFPKYEATIMVQVPVSILQMLFYKNYGINFSVPENCNPN